MARVSGGIKIDGLAAVVRHLVELGLEVDDLKDAFSSISDEGARLASRLAPKKSGALAANVRGNRARSSAHVAVGGVAVPYAGPINYGWARHNISANGFLQRTDKQWQPYSLRRLEQEINAQISKRGMR